ncbi:DUF4238 domain-containing protein [Intestinibacter sp.]
MNNKKNQHYVWQKYLEAWTKDGKIVCLRNKNKIINANTRNVASRKHFYKINNLTYNDCQLIRKIFIDKQPAKPLLEGWIAPIENFFKLYDESIKLNGVNQSLEEKKELKLKNVLEELHTNIESNASSSLRKAQLGDLSFITDTDTDIDYDFISYLSFQYLRTNKMKQSVKQSVGSSISLFNNFDDAFNLIVPILSTMFSISIYNHIKNKQLYCYLIKNITKTIFITGDQPVINTKAKFSSETDELELYYPLSPSIALIITKEKNFNTEWSIEQVKKYNDMIESQSLEQIFASDEEVLKQYIVE